MTSRTVVLGDGAWAALARAAEEALPFEMVGLLAGAGDALVVDRFVPVAGATCSEDHFAMPAPVFAAAEAALRARGERWLGFAHSHPNGITALSAADRACLWRDCLQLVVVPGPGDGATIRAFWLAKDRVDTLAIVRAEAVSP